MMGLLQYGDMKLDERIQQADGSETRSMFHVDDSSGTLVIK